MWHNRHQCQPNTSHPFSSMGCFYTDVSLFPIPVLRRSRDAFLLTRSKVYRSSFSWVMAASPLCFPILVRYGFLSRYLFYSIFKEREGQCFVLSPPICDFFSFCYTFFKKNFWFFSKLLFFFCEQLHSLYLFFLHILFL